MPSSVRGGAVAACIARCLKRDAFNASFLFGIWRSDARDGRGRAVEEEPEIKGEDYHLTHDVHLDGACPLQVELLQGEATHQGPTRARGYHDRPHQHGRLSGGQTELGLQILGQEGGHP